MATVLFTIVAPSRRPSLTVPSNVSPNSHSTRRGPITAEYTPSPPIQPFLPANLASHSGAGSALMTAGGVSVGGAALPIGNAIATIIPVAATTGHVRIKSAPLVVLLE